MRYKWHITQVRISCLLFPSQAIDADIISRFCPLEWTLAQASSRAISECARRDSKSDSLVSGFC